MFESTLEAQGWNDGERKLGALSLAALAHLGIGLTIVAVTALIVPKVKPPNEPAPSFIVVPRVQLADLPERPLGPPAPPKGTNAPKPGKALTAPRIDTDVPPMTTPDRLPEPLPGPAPEGPAGPDDGTPGDPDGSLYGVPGGTGDDAAGSGLDRLADPVEMTGDMLSPKLLVKVEPSYPDAARRAGLGGRVTVRAVIAEDGSVESVGVFASTNPLFDAAAVDAVRRWRYRPALMNGRPVRVYFTVRVDFVVR